MKISLNWLKRYINIDMDPDQISEILTMIGLEVEGMEIVEAVKGGLAGVVVGKVETCEKHPGADKLSLTTVDIGGEETIQIVCGAPNVAAGQKVLVASIGTTLYTPEGEAWKIKKGKIRGEVSEGMICAEDELGLGNSHDGIMVLAEEAPIGSSAKAFLGMKSDVIYEIGLTPNRSDATSHIGVAQDLAAYLQINHNLQSDVKMPDVSEFQVDMHTQKVEVNVDNKEACPRYSGVVISDVEIKESPDWLKALLKAIDVRPINNIVDITNFILHEIGQPLHAFDVSQIAGNTINVKTCPEGTIFTSLDEVDRKLTEKDLMICDGDGNGMCIAGVFGGIKSGVTSNTTAIFLESAHFDAKWIRNTSTRHLLRTDAAKVFEKGSDPNITVYALKRAILLMKELAGGNVTSDIVDIYPKTIKRAEVHVKYANVNRLIGVEISKEEVHQILRAMDMEIDAVDSESIMVHVPTNKADVTREIDVIEEILRIYGFNKVAIAEELNSKVYYTDEIDKYKVRDKISNLLTSQGLTEIMGLSLIESRHILNTTPILKEDFVYINNTSNIQLDIMRPEMMVSGLYSVLHNHNRQNTNLKFYEYGKAYRNSEEGHIEEEFLTIFLSGKDNDESWRMSNKKNVDFYSIKQVVHNLLHKVGMTSYQVSDLEDERFDYGLSYHRGKNGLVKFGKVSDKIAAYIGLKSEVYYAEISMAAIFTNKHKTAKIEEVSKFPAVRRDLAVIVDQGVKFDQLVKIARKVDKKNLVEINLFDVYVNKEHVGEGKKSYAMSYLFSDTSQTLKDKTIDKVMSNMIAQYEKQLNAEIRR